MPRLHYQAAVLAEVAEIVFTVEVRPSLHEAARERLGRLHYSNVHCRCADGRFGWPEKAPFDDGVVSPRDFVFTPDGTYIVVYGDLDGSGQDALFVISFDRSGVAVEVSGDLGDGEIERFQVR